MANALLSKAYDGRKAGELLTDISDREVKTIERLGLGAEVKDGKPAEDEKPAGRKPEKSAVTE